MAESYQRVFARGFVVPDRVLTLTAVDALAEPPGEGDVAGDGGEAEDIELGRGEGEKDGDGVVLAEVGVDDDLAGHCGLLWRE